MLVIRTEQMETFRDAARRTFENDMVAHLSQFSPPLFRTLGEEQLRCAIRFGTCRAAGHGFTFRGPVRLYLEAMLLFGSHFDTDPQYLWAVETLADQESAPQLQRAFSLYMKILDYRHF